MLALKKNSDYLYPNRVNLLDKYASPWDNYEQISDIDDKIKENLAKLVNEQLQGLKDGLFLFCSFDSPPS